MASELALPGPNGGGICICICDPTMHTCVLRLIRQDIQVVPSLSLSPSHSDCFYLSQDLIKNANSAFSATRKLFILCERAGQHAWEIFEVIHRMLLLLYLSLALSAVGRIIRCENHSVAAVAAACCIKLQFNLG